MSLHEAEAHTPAVEEETRLRAAREPQKVRKGSAAEGADTERSRVLAERQARAEEEEQRIAELEAVAPRQNWNPQATGVVNNLPPASMRCARQNQTD